MDHVQRYVVEANVSRFMDMLEHEPEGPNRSRLKGILLAEENRFAKHSERLAITEHFLDNCSQRIREQRDRIQNMGDDHPHLAIATFLLSNLLDIQRMVQAKRDCLEGELDYNR